MKGWMWCVYISWYMWLHVGVVDERFTCRSCVPCTSFRRAEEKVCWTGDQLGWRQVASLLISLLAICFVGSRDLCSLGACKWGQAYTSHPLFPVAVFRRRCSSLPVWICIPGWNPQKQQTQFCEGRSCGRCWLYVRRMLLEWSDKNHW